MGDLRIIMYHYVRQLERSRYPRIKARCLNDFRTQLDYISRNFTVVTAEQVIASIGGLNPLPPNSAWLTFDDGYLDHYTSVLPLLLERGWQGSFFPPANAIQKGELLDVNKIHFILASSSGSGLVVDEIRRFIDTHAGFEGIDQFDRYWADYAHASRYDVAEVIFIKRVLQQALPERLRAELVDELFEKFVTVDEKTFAAELYMSQDQLRTMLRLGMYVGSHGAKHCWLDHLNSEDQAQDVDASLAFLKTIGAPVQDWVMCYPYGVYNDSLIGILKSRGCACAITTKTAVANTVSNGAFELPRLDTNDLPIQ
jgi:peptidoglycan/xylan/chitin deacetylase (PgdA/CDA1 family)